MLHHKLKQIEDGITFVGRTTKQARSQGKKIQITAEQEISRCAFYSPFSFCHFTSSLWAMYLYSTLNVSLLNVGYWGTWPGLTCKKKTIKLLKNTIGEL